MSTQTLTEAKMSHHDLLKDQVAIVTGSGRGIGLSIAKEYASSGITCNAIAPGFIDTAMTQKLKPEIKEQYMKFIPLGRFGSPDDVAECAYFFCTGGSYVTGQVIVVDGGMFM